jgi:hypothetical protein
LCSFLRIVVPHPFSPLRLSFSCYHSRALKSLGIYSSSDTSAINGTSSFELYILRNDLSVNPIAENAASLRDQAISEGGLCDISIYDLNDVANDIVSDIVASITGGDCGVTACSADQCVPCNSIVCSGDIVAGISEFRYCDCDLVVGKDDTDILFMFSVAYKGTVSDPVENDIKVS